MLHRTFALEGSRCRSGQVADKRRRGRQAGACTSRQRNYHKIASRLQHGDRVRRALASCYGAGVPLQQPCLGRATCQRLRMSALISSACSSPRGPARRTRRRAPGAGAVPQTASRLKRVGEGWFSAGQRGAWETGVGLHRRRGAAGVRQFARAGASSCSRSCTPPISCQGTRKPDPPCRARGG